MKIKSIYSFLVHPSKHEDIQPLIGGTKVELSGKLFDMLSNLFIQSDQECKIEISFNSKVNIKQNNECRNDIIRVLQNQTMLNAHLLAERLQQVTTRRSGLGLLFIIIGKTDSLYKICISRFPADIGILAEENSTSLRVEFLEKVFMKNAYSYKAVVYKGHSFDTGFWFGKAIDKQLNDQVAISNYWIKEFLLSDFRTTSASGTRRLAVVLKDVANSTKYLETKEEIAASVRLSKNLDGEKISINEFLKKFSFSQITENLILKRLDQKAIKYDKFVFLNSEFQKHLPYRSIELNNGAILSSASDKFDDCFKRKKLNNLGDEYEFTTTGKIVNERFRKR